MRFSKLYLKAYGPFTERVIDFEIPGASLHILYGPNEAGKSSLLRAIHAFLFGIPERTRDNFIHDNAALRVGGVLTDDAGQQFMAMRRKARKQSLHEWSGMVGTNSEGATLADNSIFQLLSGLEEAQFSRLFGIDRDELVNGGLAILEGQGDVGESLFEAGAGLVGLRDLRSKLEAEAMGLFAPRASKPVINSTLVELEEAKRTMKSAAVRTDEWTRRNDAYKAVALTLEATKRALTEKRQELERLSRILKNLPLVARRQKSLKELETLSVVPDLAHDFSERRSAAQIRLMHAEHQREEAKRWGTELDTQLSGISIPEGCLEREALIQGVYRRLGSFQQAELEIPSLTMVERNSLDEAQGKYRELGIEGALSEAEKFRPKKADQAKVRELIQEHAHLTARSVELQEHATNLLADIEKAQHVLTVRPVSQDYGNLEGAVEAAALQVESEHRLSTLIRDLAERNREIKRKAHDLGDHSAAALRELRPPSKATLERMHQEANAISAERKSVSAQIAQKQRDLQVLEGERTKLEAGGVVPSEDELAKAREYRNRGWQIVRQAYIERTAGSEDLARGYAVELGLPEAYEHAVLNADTVVDGLRLDTERITRHNVILDRISNLNAGTNEDEARLRELDAREEKWREEWAGITGALEVSFPSVRELEAWVYEREAIVAGIAEVELRQHGAEEMRRTTGAARANLTAAMAVHGIDVSETDPLSTMSVKARELLARLRREKAEHEEAKKAIAELQGELASNTTRSQRLATELTDWRSRWNAMTEAVGLGDTVDPKQAEGRLALLQELFEAIDEAQRARKERKAMQAMIEGYSEEVRTLASALNMDLAGKSIGDLASMLYAQHQAAMILAQKHKQLTNQLEEARRALMTATAEFVRKEQEMAELCGLAAVGNAMDLPAVEGRARHKRELQEEVAGIERQLIEFNSAPLSQILAEAETKDRDQLIAQTPILEQEIGELEIEQINVAQQLRDAEVALYQVDGSDKAAEAYQISQEYLATVRNAAEDYIRLKASSFIIARAIEAYRQKHQGPILSRAGEYFSGLTRESFRSLDLDLSKDSPVLVGIRADGKYVSISGMSEGTRDQLYLALRLAAIESHLGNGGPVPVIVDDILVQFDDIRAQAAIEALGTLATRTQILCLTHHAHLLTLAERTAARGILAVHRLDVPLNAEATAVAIGDGN